MRLFVAVHPPYAVVSALDTAVTPLRAESPSLRWTAPEQWHLTLAFLGDVDARRLDGLRTRLARAAGRTPALELSFRGAGAFSARRRARVLWVGVAGDVDPLRLLAARAGAAARRTGIAVEDRAYRPHLTLARARRDPVDVSALVADLEEYAGPAWRADDLRLMHSVVGPGGASHELVEAWPLAGS